MTKKQIARNLKKWAKIVRDAPDETFDMSYWKCGTTYCAAGHLACSPFGRELGLKLVKERDADDWSLAGYSVRLGDRKKVGEWRYDERPADGYAVAEALGATRDEIDRIVFATSASKATVVEKIERLAEKYAK
jgi:hypothetical protein